MSLHDVEKSLIEKFLETYTSNWRLPENDPKKILGLEIILTSACNTKCDYCYYKNFSDFLNPVSICGEDILYENTFKLLSWMKEHSYSPYQIDIFSGEFFNMKSWDKILQLLLDNTQSSIMIPTNTTFLFDEEKTNKIEEFLNNYRHRLYLSLSVDGKYLDNDSRPLRSGKKYDDAFYDKMFKFGAKWNLNYHPMISKVHIDKWIDNYKWYIENICKYYKTTALDAVSRIYLLEVRNPDWTHEDLSFLENFIYFLIRYVKNLCGSTLNFINFLRNPSNCNILSSIYAKNYRGLGCSFSNTLEALSKYTYEQNREDGYHSFTAQELLEIVAKDLVNSDFEYIGEEAISGWNRKVYQLSYQTLIDKLKQYFSSDVEFTPSDIVNGQGAVLPNVNFGDGSGMAISSYDNTTGTYQVYFGGVGGTSGPKPQINERKVMDAYRLGDKIYVTEKAIYYTSSSSDYTNFIYNIYSHPNQNDLVDTLNFQGDTISSQSISVDNYLDRAATISYVFSKDNNQYVFSSSKIS